jgi:hypothetical protein
LAFTSSAQTPELSADSVSADAIMAAKADQVERGIVCVKNESPGAGEATP